MKPVAQFERSEELASGSSQSKKIYILGENTNMRFKKFIYAWSQKTLHSLGAGMNGSK
jgi:hypothetical protein